MGEVSGFSDLDFPRGEYAYAVVRAEKDSEHLTPKGEKEGCCWRLESIELLQYTGLKDKYGVEIYEGNIVEFVNHNNNRKLKRAVEWDEESLSFTFGGNTGWKFIDYLKMTHGTMEIIGNIYENPELLK